MYIDRYLYLSSIYILFFVSVLITVDGEFGDQIWDLSGKISEFSMVIK